MDDLQLVLQSLGEIKAAIAALVEQRAAKDWYTTAEVAAIVGRAEYSVREWCRKGQAMAVKAPNGRGWLISHAELTRLRNEGPIPERRSNHQVEFQHSPP